MAKSAKTQANTSSPNNPISEYRPRISPHLLSFLNFFA
jgi:hypothetical protein